VATVIHCQYRECFHNDPSDNTCKKEEIVLETIVLVEAGKTVLYCRDNQHFYKAFHGKLP
jgi:hypothetical protein